MSKLCERCGELLVRKQYPHRLESSWSFARRRFCNKSCAAGDPLSFTAQHNISKKFRKDKCERCGSIDRLHVHHKSEDWTDNREENLETLCMSCHMIHHNIKHEICSVDGCNGEHYSNGFCVKHNTRFMKYNDPLFLQREYNDNKSLKRKLSIKLSR